MISAQLDLDVRVDSYIKSSAISPASHAEVFKAGLTALAQDHTESMVLWRQVRKSTTTPNHLNPFRHLP